MVFIDSLLDFLMLVTKAHAWGLLGDNSSILAQFQEVIGNRFNPSFRSQVFYVPLPNLAHLGLSVLVHAPVKAVEPLFVGFLGQVVVRFVQ